MPALAVEYISHAPAVFHSPAPVVESVAPAPAVVLSPAPVMESIAPMPAVIFSPDPVVESIAPAPAVVLSSAPATEFFFFFWHPRLQWVFSPAPVEEYVSPMPALFQASAPLMECSSPAPLVFPSPGQSHHSGTSEGAKCFQFCSTISCGRTTGSVESCFVLFLAVGHGGGRTPNTPMGLASTSMRCGSRRGCAEGPCSAAPHDFSSILHAWWAWFLPPVAYWIGFGFQANIVDDYVLLSAFSAV